MDKVHKSVEIPSKMRLEGIYRLCNRLFKYDECYYKANDKRLKEKKKIC